MCHAARVGNNVMLANASVINDGVNVEMVFNWSFFYRGT